VPNNKAPLCGVKQCGIIGTTCRG